MSSEIDLEVMSDLNDTEVIDKKVVHNQVITRVTFLGNQRISIKRGQILSVKRVKKSSVHRPAKHFAQISHTMSRKTNRYKSDKNDIFS